MEAIVRCMVKVGLWVGMDLDQGRWTGGWKSRKEERSGNMYYYS